MNKKITEERETEALDNRIPCPVAGKILLDLSVACKEVAGMLHIKITNCGLGCF